MSYKFSDFLARDRWMHFASAALQLHRPIAVPVYRLRNDAIGDHFYTVSETERDNAISTYGYVYEGIAFYAYNAIVSSTELVQQAAQLADEMMLQIQNRE